MSKFESNQTKSDEFYDKLKENYILRIQECDNFSKRFSTACLDVNTEFLFGMLNLIQQNIELQKKYMKYYPSWWNYTLTTKQSDLITEAWIQSVQYLDSFYVEFLRYTKNNLRTFNKTSTQVVQDIERLYDIYRKTDSTQKDKSEENPSSPKQVVIKREPNPT